MWAREVYFKYFPSQRMACTKATMKRRAVVGIKTIYQPPQLQPGRKTRIKIIPQPPQLQPRWKTTWVGESIKRRYQPGMKALHEIWKFQRLTELLIPKMAFLRVVRVLLQWESTWYRIQVGAVLALHEAAEAYLIWLLEDMNLYTIHAKWVRILPKDMQLARRIWGRDTGISGINFDDICNHLWLFD